MTLSHISFQIKGTHPGSYIRPSCQLFRYDHFIDPLFIHLLTKASEEERSERPGPLCYYRQEKDSPTISFRNIPPGIVQKHYQNPTSSLKEEAKTLSPTNNPAQKLQRGCSTSTPPTVSTAAEKRCTVDHTEEQHTSFPESSLKTRRKTFATASPLKPQHCFRSITALLLPLDHRLATMA
ncbi:hypothetical protein ACLB2K_004525 [Fragaria x ananassa]